MSRTFSLPILAVLAAGMLAASPAAHAEDLVVNLTIRDHKFEPATVNVPANTRVKLLIRNTDATPEEFESHVLNREKVIAGNSTGTVLIGPLKPGAYSFVGEFHEKTAKGVILAK